MEQTTDNHKKKSHRSGWRAIILVVLLGLLLRIWAAWQLPIDFDEPTYMEAGYKYAELIQRGDLNGIINYSGSYEHPPLVKILYGFAILIFGRGAEWSTAVFYARMVSVVFGSLAVLVIACINPLAGFFMAVQTLMVKYTSQSYIEALPMFFSLLSLAVLLRARPGKKWLFFFSAVCLGISGAGKYSYLPMVFVILYLLIWEKKQRLVDIIIYLLVAGVTFLAFDPYLWHAPLQRLVESLSFHASYAHGSHVQEVNYPWYQPFLWVSRSYGFIWHPDIFFYLGLDGLIFLFALPGAWLELKKRKWIVIWLVTGMLSLLLWPTKWPQYTLVVLPAFCLAASTAVKIGYEFVKEQELYWEWLHNMFPRPARRYVVIGSILLGLLFVGALGSQIVIAINRIGWSTKTSDNTMLPNNAINAMLTLPDGRIVIGTDGGVVFWRAAGKDEVVDEWVVYDGLNSPLPNDKVLSIAMDQKGVLWFGTMGGVTSFTEGNWVVYDLNNVSLENGQVNSIAVDGKNHIWIGTSKGAAVFDGAEWKSIIDDASGLVDNAIFAVAVDPGYSDRYIWFGTLYGVSRLEVETDDWLTFSRDNLDLGFGGVSDLVFDDMGRLWVCTEGGGISIWDGNSWTYLKVSNSKLPYSIVESMAELEPNIYWIAASIPNSAGGVVARYDGVNWNIYRKGFSGYSGAETVAIVKDNDGRYWFGTRTQGIDIFEP